jgi:predicted phosphodiesterase
MPLQKLKEEMLRDPDQIATLTREEWESLLRETEEVLEKEPNLLLLPSSGYAIFVGDTHGDFDATKKVISRYLGSNNNKVIFLGDYVDRGPQSMENINYLSLLKTTYPEDVYLLMGNHEAYDLIPHYPANFWWGLDTESYTRYAALFSKLPLAVTTENGVLALHGALPDVEKLGDINEINLGSEEWVKIIWGDFQDSRGRVLGGYVGRPQFGRDYFTEIMQGFGKNLLIRSHQPFTPILYDNRCLTLFTSSAYSPLRTIAIVDLEKEIKTTADLTIETI